jgi:hypothetical protein
MNQQFKLSNRQRYAMDRGVALQVAMPLDIETYHDNEADPLAVAKRMLPDESDCIDVARFDVVRCVRPLGGGVTGELGMILADHEQPDADKICWLVPVVVADVTLDGYTEWYPRIQFPGSLIKETKNA